MNHPFDPVFDSESKILILGTFPSVKSRENGFYYGHPQNRFWKVISAVCETDVPITSAAKKQLLLNHKIALWDVLHSCEIVGSSDASITNAVPNDISALITHSKITLICFNGKKAEALFRSFNPKLDLPMITLPSTSAANAIMSLDTLMKRWDEALVPRIQSRETQNK